MLTNVTYLRFDLSNQIIFFIQVNVLFLFSYSNVRLILRSLMIKHYLSLNRPCVCKIRTRVPREQSLLNEENMAATLPTATTEKKLFGLFIWPEDDPIGGNIFNLSLIEHPRKDYADYKEGDQVKVKYPNYGLVPGIIARITGKIYPIKYHLGYLVSDNY